MRNYRQPRLEPRAAQALDVPGAVLNPDNWMVFLDPGDADVRLQTLAFGKAVRASSRSPARPAAAVSVRQAVPKLRPQLDGAAFAGHRFGVAAGDEVAEPLDRKVGGLGVIARAQSRCDLKLAVTFLRQPGIAVGDAKNDPRKGEIRIALQALRSTLRPPAQIVRENV